MSANMTEMVDAGIPSPRIERIWILGELRIGVQWAEGFRVGRTDEIDLSPAINSYRFYRPLRNSEAMFRTAHLIDDGHAIAWELPDMEMSAETVESLARESMSSADFAEFLKRNKLTQQAAAFLLGRSRRQIAYYLNPGPVPRIVALACFGYEALRLAKENENARRLMRDVVPGEPFSGSKPRSKAVA
jgi:hypothetical protein